MTKLRQSETLAQVLLNQLKGAVDTPGKKVRKG